MARRVKTPGTAASVGEAGATPQGPVTHGASKGGVAPASPKFSVTSFSAALSLLISSLFFKFGPPRSEANGEVERGEVLR